ncbi:hypothetical protein [Aestuariibaculum suncheonense]|uniref:Uncharacterized protein n=1 Tax=Aestuariibaculum suncheonense TaxID=1028745 RepID=A0A8J6QH46_9FLAO|nr:hypothetical protein [Aestuariibaculum suncheonense]MBD0835707.1 hypothetical protein [Aestuariibaculum suncheonense]
MSKKLTFQILAFIGVLHLNGQNLQCKSSIEDSGSTFEVTNDFYILRINSNLNIIQKAQIVDFGIYSKFEMPVLFEVKLNEKWKLFSGVNLMLFKDGLTGNDSPLLNANFGIEYEPTNNLMFNAQFNYRSSNDNPIKTDFTSGLRESFTVGSKLKF